MSVQISELEVVPGSPRESAQPQQQGQQQPQQQAPSPELEHEIARTVALLHSRDLRLHAD
jgi:hypothetical protein